MGITWLFGQRKEVRVQKTEHRVVLQLAQQLPKKKKNRKQKIINKKEKKKKKKNSQ